MAGTTASRPTLGVPYQAKNKPHGDGILPGEGRPVDIRVHMGEYMSAVLTELAASAGISTSAYMRQALRAHLKAMSIEF